MILGSRADPSHEPVVYTLEKPPDLCSTSYVNISEEYIQSDLVTILCHIYDFNQNL